MRKKVNSNSLFRKSKYITNIGHLHKKKYSAADYKHTKMDTDRHQSLPF